MKKITITVLLLITVSLGLNAQYSIGLYAGGSFCKVSKKVASDPQNLDLNGPGSSYGINLGLIAEMLLNKNFTLVANIGFFNKNSFWKESQLRINHQYIEPVIGIKINPLNSDKKFINNLSITPSFGYSLKLDKENDLFENKNCLITRLELAYSIKRLSVMPFFEWDINSFYTINIPAIQVKSNFYFRNYGLKIGYTLFNIKKK
jgi:hypothetical protein